MFEIKNLSKQYETEFALQDVTMSIGKGMNFIVGASGSGKTTLLKILSGIEQDFEGSVLFNGKSIESFSGKNKSALYNSTFGFVWQDFHLLEDATVSENLLLPTYLKNEAAPADADKILKQMKLEDLKDQKVKFLSGGQKQRVAIARELMKNPQVIFCDEPTSALDAENAKIIITLLRVLSKKRTIIVVTHDTSLIEAGDSVFEFDKGELISVPDRQKENNSAYTEADAPKLSFKKACQLALMNLKNKPGRFLISVLSLIISSTLLLTTFSGTITNSGQAEFDKLMETYGEGILDISLVGSFMSAAGGNENQPNGSVNQDIGGLYEKYQDDERVEFIVSAQPFENIRITLDGKAYSIEKTGNSPVLTKLLSGNVPAGEEFQVVVPFKFIESIGLTPETALGKKIDFSATVFQWVNNTPLEKPVQLQATICGVADNTVVYDYEGNQYSFTVDDSFFFNRSAIEEIRRQADIADVSANFTLRAKTPADLISLKDELNRNGIVPLGRFELVEDIVRLNEQTAEQSGAAGAVIGVLALLLAVIIFGMTALLRKREYAIYKVSGYHNGHLSEIALAETVLTAITALIFMIPASPFLNMAIEAMFNASILSDGKLEIGMLLIPAVAVIAFAAGLPAVFTTSFSSMLKAGDKS